MKPLIFALLLIAGPVWAHTNEDQAKVCYLFKGDKLTKQAPCVVSSGGGAGGIYAQMQMGRQTYNVETDYNGDNATINDKPGQAYTRNEFYKRLPSSSQNEAPFMYCFQRKGSQISICHN